MSLTFPFVLEGERRTRRTQFAVTFALLFKHSQRMVSLVLGWLAGLRWSFPSLTPTTLIGIDLVALVRSNVDYVS